jgi:hypothetical protein
VKPLQKAKPLDETEYKKNYEVKVDNKVGEITEGGRD